jgi:hypothetical protein
MNLMLNMKDINKILAKIESYVKPFSLILMYLPIDYNCFDNQLYHKTKIICKKRVTYKKKRGDFNFASYSRESDFGRRYIRIREKGFIQAI